MKIGLLREWKLPADTRVALSPAQCEQLMEAFPDVEVIAESSPDRIFKDKEYKAAGVRVLKNISECDIFLGIKEVPQEKLNADKTYLFFSHTVKKQEYNRSLLQAIIKKNIKLIDYEMLLNEDGKRVLGFGKWAGVVGTYNAFLTWGQKTGQFELTPAYKTSGHLEVMESLKELDLRPLRIIFTGSGRVASGIRETLETMGIKEVTAQEYINVKFREPVFTQLTNWDLFHHKGGKEWDESFFYDNHQEYCCEFDLYPRYTDIFINGMYWEDDMAPLFTKKDTADPSFRIKVIADITCDVEGGVPITMEATDIYNPTFGWSRSEQKKVKPFGEDTIDVMAVTNLPTELPREASEEFGKALIVDVLPLLIKRDKNGIIKGATVTKGGKLTKEYAYLADFVAE